MMIERTEGSPYDVLTRSDRVVDLRNRHRDYHLRLAEQAEPELSGPDQVAWLDVLEAEHQNLLAAIDWSLNEGEAEDALRLASALWPFWWTRGHWTERRTLERAIAASPTPSPARAKALVGAGVLAYEGGTGDLGACRRMLERARDEGADHALHGVVARALIHLGKLSYTEGARDEGVRLMREALAVARASGDRHHEVAALGVLSNRLVWTAGAEAEGRRLLEEAFSLGQALGDRRGLAWGHYSIGGIAWLDGNEAEMRAHYEAALALAREVREEGLVVMLLQSMGEVAADEDDYPGSRRHFDEAIEVARRCGYPGLSRLLSALGRVSREHGDFARSRSCLEEAIRIEDTQVPSRDLGEAVCQLALTLAAAGDQEAAISLGHRAVDDARQLAADARRRALYTLGVLAMDQGRHEQARAVFEEALDIARRHGAAWQNNELIRLGNVAAAEGDLASARVRFEAAIEAGPSWFRRFFTEAGRALAEIARREGDLEQSFALHAEALRKSAGHNYRRHVAGSLEDLAALAFDAGKPQRAARLLGAADALRESISVRQPAHERIEKANVASAVRKALGDATYAERVAEGGSMTVPAAVEYALADADEV